MNPLCSLKVCLHYLSHTDSRVKDLRLIYSGAPAQHGPYAVADTSALRRCVLLYLCIGVVLQLRLCTVNYAVTVYRLHSSFYENYVHLLSHMTICTHTFYRVVCTVLCLWSTNYES